MALKCDFYRLVWDGAPETQEEQMERKAERLRRRKEVDLAYGFKPLPLPDDLK